MSIAISSLSSLGLRRGLLSSDAAFVVKHCALAAAVSAAVDGCTESGAWMERSAVREGEQDYAVARLPDS